MPPPENAVRIIFLVFHLMRKSRLHSVCAEHCLCPAGTHSNYAHHYLKAAVRMQCPDNLSHSIIDQHVACERVVCSSTT